MKVYGGDLMLFRLEKEKMPDLLLIMIIILLVTVGITFVYSASHIWAENLYNDRFFYVKRQMIFTVFGFMLMFLLMNFPYHYWRKFSVPILIFSFLLLLLVLIPNIGMVRGGARSWIGIGSFSIQPSEFVKLALILFLANYLAHYYQSMTNMVRGFLLPIIFFIIPFALIMLQPDLGTGIVIVCTCILMLFIAGVPLNRFVFFGLIGIVSFIYLIISAPYRIKRITAFLDPWRDPLGEGFQIIQSLYAIGPGKLMGVGFGNSLQKYFYLPEPQTDFIFSIIAEEVGFLGTIFILLLFFIFCYRGIYIAMNVQDLYGRYVAFGIISMLMIQVLINISVVIGLIPVTGITLSFISYVVSSLTLILVCLCILLNISKYAKSN